MPTVEPRPSVSVVIPCWNPGEHLDRCLASLAEQSRPPLQIVAVDNASSDGTVARLEQAEGVELVRNSTNLGFSPAANQGIARSRGDLVLLLNPDVVLAPEFLERAVDGFDDPAVGCVAGKLLRSDRTTLDSAGQLLGRSGRVIDRGYGRADAGQYDADGEVLAACGAAAVYRRSMLEDVALDGEPFDGAFFAFHEDLDLGWRSRLYGWRTRYCHRAVAYHVRSATAGSTRRWLPATLRRPAWLQFHILKNRYLCMIKNDRVGRLLAHAPWIVARELVVGAFVVLVRPALLRRATIEMPELVRRAWRHRRSIQDVRRRRGLAAGPLVGAS